MAKHSDQDTHRWVEERLGALGPDSGWQPNRFRALACFRAQRAKQGSRKRKWGWLAAGAVTAGLPLIAFPATRSFAEHCLSACVIQSNRVRELVTGKVFSSFASSVYVKPQDRKMAPDFILEDASGSPVKLSDLRGKVVLLNFWATWCAPCRVEIPWFIEFQDTNKNIGFTALGVSLDEDGWDAVRPYIDHHKISYPVMVGNADLAQLYGAASLPTTFIIDKAGRIAATHVGICSKSDYEADIRAVFNDR